MHNLIVGTTLSGKSTLCKLVCSELKKNGERTAVLTSKAEEGWEADFKTTDGPAFLRWAKDPENQSSFLFIDEGGQSIGKYNQEMEWLATTSRHEGHTAFFMLQASQQISTAIRSCCSTAYIFATTKGVLKLLAEDFNEPAIMKHSRIGQYRFLVASRFTALHAGRLDDGGASVYIGRIDEVNPAEGAQLPEVDDTAKDQKNVKKSEKVLDNADPVDPVDAPGVSG